MICLNLNQAHDPLTHDFSFDYSLHTGLRVSPLSTSPIKHLTTSSLIPFPEEQGMEACVVPFFCPGSPELCLLCLSQLLEFPSFSSKISSLLDTINTIPASCSTPPCLCPGMRICLSAQGISSVDRCHSPH